jgi:type II secretory pathway pseudopilin PulG
MAALLVALSVMAILMTAAMPAWRQLVRREKEAELVFRGEQYARAIGLFQRKAGPGVLPPSLDVLVEQKFLRKQYKDPITGADFELLRATLDARPGEAGADSSVQGSPGQAPGQAPGGIVGVVSTSTDESIRIYNGRTHYNEWQFVFVPRTPAAGAGPEDRGRGGRGETAGPARGGREGRSPFQRGAGPGPRGRGEPPRR